MKISKAHQKFADRLNNQRAVEHPEEFLGSNWKDVLNFWLFLDTLSGDQLESVYGRYDARDAAAWGTAADAALVVAALVVAGADARDVVWAAWVAARAGAVVAWDVAAGYATYELIGSHILLNKNQPLSFLPLFLNLVTP